MGFGEVLNKINNTGIKNDTIGLKQAGLYKIIVSDSELEIDNTTFQYGTFLLNPESYEETKASVWAPATIPGQSDPVLQWVSGGPRVISFDALITRETSSYNITNKKSGLFNSITSALETSVIGNLAASAAGVFDTIASALNPLNSTNPIPPMSIGNELNYYRSLLYPEYGSDGRLLQSPPLVILDSGINAPRSVNPGDSINTDEHDLWVVSNLRIQITKQLPNLLPLEAIVNFQLTQYITSSFSNNTFLSR